MRLAVVPHPTLGPLMGGPGWRYWRLAGALAAQHEVTVLAPPGSSPPEPDGPPLEALPPPELAAAAARYDAVVTQGIWISPLRDGAFLGATRLLLDYYDPLCVELPEHYAALPQDPHASRRYDDHIRRMAYLMGQADALLVANARQRDLVLGMALATGAMRLEDFQAEGGPGRRLLEVPCGTDPGAPPRTSDDALGLAWGGGTWGWFDTDLALELARRLHRHDPRYRLVVPGGEPPGPAGRLADASGMGARVHQDAALAAAVDWHPGWRPRDQFLAILAGCRLGLSLNPAGEESRFAHRTRVLDYLTAGLPCVLSAGDALAEEGAREGWARVVPPGDVEAAVAACRTLAPDGPERTAALAAAARGSQARRWSRVVAPLARYLDDPPARRPRQPWLWSALTHQLRRLPGL